MRDFWLEAPKGGRGLLLRKDLGLVCPKCATKLRVLQARYGFVALAIYLGGLLVGSLLLDVFGIDKYSIKGLLCFAVILGLLEFLRWRYFYLFLSVRLLEGDEKVSFPLSDRTFSLE